VRGRVVEVPCEPLAQRKGEEAAGRPRTLCEAAPELERDPEMLEGLNVALLPDEQVEADVTMDLGAEQRIGVVEGLDQRQRLAEERRSRLASRRST
jgi:hypothetical protein